jgi:acyl-CoA synthetase (AMP-forming)/AMP-acid ligase II
MPQFHSFGICFNIFTPLLTGASCVIMSPGRFVKKTEEWFKTIATYQATHTAAPNFAFDYCCASIDVASFKDCSLRSLQAIVSGGEPFRKETHENFIKKFETLGLSKNVFCIDYGSSETGAIVASKPGKFLRFLSLDRVFLEAGKVKHSKQKNKGKHVAGCGEVGAEIQIVIVNPETSVPCVTGEIGEIWVKSASVAVGYLNQPEETTAAFGCKLATTGEGDFFRSGDLGFIEDNELFIVGRWKEVIIIHGKNHYPVDLEWTIKKAIPALILPVVVFGCEIDRQEKVVVVQEIENEGNRDLSKTKRRNS